MTEIFKRQYIKLSELRYNTGQVPGLPRNPRFIRDEKFELICQSLREDPEFLEVREILVYVTENGERVIFAGEMRARGAKEEKFTKVPCKVFPTETTPEKLRAYAIKDNTHYGEWDMDEIANEWSDDRLEDWGVGLWGMDDREDSKTAVSFKAQSSIKFVFNKREVGSINDRIISIMDDNNLESKEQVLTTILSYYEKGHNTK